MNNYKNLMSKNYATMSSNEEQDVKKKSVTAEECLLNREENTSQEYPAEFNELRTAEAEIGEHLPKFPVDCLPEVLRNYVVEVGESLQVPVDMPAVISLSVIALCVQGKYWITPKADWTEPLNLYTMIIADPSERKSSVFSELIRPIHAYEDERKKTEKYELVKRDIQCKVLKADLKRLEEKIMSGKGNGSEQEEMIRKQMELEELEKKKSMKLIVDDITPEALANIMAENNERIGIFSSEGGIVGMMEGRYNKHSNIDLYLKAFTGDPYSSNRMCRDGESLSNPLITMALTVQPQVTSSMIKNEELNGRGLTARILYSFPESMIGNRHFETDPISREAREAYAELVTRLLSINVEANDNIIYVSKDATHSAEKFFFYLEPRIKNEYKHMSGWAGKIHGTTYRIAGLLHLAQYGAEAGRIELEEETMDSAIAIGKYFVAHAKRVYEDLCHFDTDENQDADYLLSKIHSLAIEYTAKGVKVTQFTKRELWSKCRNRFSKVEKMEAGINELEKLGFIRTEKGKSGSRGGRPSDLIILVSTEEELEKNPQ